jgi:transcription initiation factor TFIIH subunit 1
MVDQSDHDTATTTPMDTSSDETISYKKVIHKKLEGIVVLTDSNLIFQPNAGPEVLIAWKTLSKHQVSPAAHPKALLKLIMTDDAANSKPNTFQFPERPYLERIRKDITLRLQKFRKANPNAAPPPPPQQLPQLSIKLPPPASPTPTALSSSSAGRKRAYSEVASPTSRAAQANASSKKTPLTFFGELDATALAVTRSSLLAANPTLRSQHHYLVKETQTVTEDDFWRTHQDLVQEEFARISGMTRAGTSSLLQSHLLLLTGRVTLGVEEMRQIFILYPAVHKAYEEKVPLELSDEQFWRKYLESEYFHRDRGRIGAASTNHNSNNADKKKNKNVKSVEEQEARAAAIGTDDLFSRYDQKIKENSNDANGARKWGTKLAVGQFDLASTFETERGELLEGPRDNHPQSASDDGKGARVIRKYNRHWAMVLHPQDAVAGSNLMTVARRSVAEVLPDDEDAKAGGGIDADMKRLVGFAMASSADANHALGKGLQNSDEYEVLNLKNVEAYYSGRPSATKVVETDNAETRKRNGFFANSMVAKMNALASSAAGTERGSILQDAFPPAQLGRELLTALTNKMAQDSQTDADALEVVKALPEDFKKRLQSYFRRSSELLRHFFGLRRLVDAQGNNTHSQKLKRIVQGMETVYREMEGMRRTLEQTETGEIMRKMCLQIMDQLDWAFKLHREGSGGGGGGGFVTIEEF